MPLSFEAEVRSLSTISGITFEVLVLDSWNENDRYALGRAYIANGDNVDETRVIIYEDGTGDKVMKKIT